MTADADLAAMRHAQSLGRRGLGQVWPNPAVGCVILQGDRVVGRGWTQPGGRPHAEVMALGQAGMAARGATAFVTLEPCAHHGQTPPCANALIAAGVARVVSAMTDPDARVAGRGHAMLRAAGVSVTEGVGADQARRDHAGFVMRITRGRPMVTLKLAVTLDGRIATAAGESRWITGPDARRMVHALRLGHDAVMVGAGTARADDPDLTVRGMGPVRQPVRVVIDSRARLPIGGRLAQTARAVPVWLCHGAAAAAADIDALAGAGVVPILCDGAVDPASALAAMGARGLTRVLCEGGGQLAASLLQAGLVDEVVAFSAGSVIGAEGRASVGPLAAQALADAPRFRLMESSAVGGDVMHRWAHLTSTP